MRTLPFLFALLPTPLLADDILLTSRVTEVTLYPSSAKIARAVPFTVPAGQHQLQLLDLPQGTPMESLRVSVSGATLGAITLREDFVPPRDTTDSEAVQEAKAKITQLENDLRTRTDKAATIRLAKEAADTRIGFLRQLGQGETLKGADPQTLRDVAQMIGDETLAARQAVINAEAQAREVDRQISDLNNEIAKAKSALNALVPEQKERNLVAVNITADTPTEGTLTVTYNTWNAGWMPVYDAHLNGLDDPTLTLKRGALIGQHTGENWQGVKLTLSTNRPSGQSNPSELWPDLRRIGDKEPPRPVLMSKENAHSGRATDAVMAEPMIVEEASATVNLDGLSVTYTHPTPVDLASDADATRITLGTLDLSATIQALAVPRRDETAFLTAAFTNTSPEMILPSTQTQFFLNGEFIGTRATDHIAAGKESRFSFGPIDGLRLRRVSEREEGDRGVLTRSNEIREVADIEIQNLTGRAWNVRLLDQVPYSEQEDLVVSWNASPDPTERDVEDRKGVMAWDFNLAPGKSQKIGLSHNLRWPEGKILR